MVHSYSSGFAPWRSQLRRARERGSKRPYDRDVNTRTCPHAVLTPQFTKQYGIKVKYVHPAREHAAPEEYL